MNTKNLTTILGGILLAIGPALQQLLATNNSWWAGLCSSILGGVLVAVRGVQK